MQLLNRALFDQVLEAARLSTRRRTNFNFHASLDENPHRFLNVMLDGTYVTPHRHLDPPKSEAFLVLEGEAAIVIFEDDGRVRAIHRLGPSAPALGIDLEPGVWHSLVVLSPHAICYEVKPGPYTAANDKEFAPWAPREGDPAAPAYLAWLQKAAVGNNWAGC